MNMSINNNSDSHQSPRYSMISYGGMESNRNFNKKDFNYFLSNCLGTHFLYLDQYKADEVEIIPESENQALNIVSTIIQRGSTTLYDNYLKTKMDKHSLTRIFNLMEIIQQQENLFYDDSEEILKIGMQEEKEPNRCEHENWKGMSVSLIKQHQRINQTLIEQRAGLDQSDENKSLANTNSRGSFIHGRIKKGSAIGIAPHETLSLHQQQINEREISFLQLGIKEAVPVDLNIPRELVREEEQLRVLKEREFLIRQEKVQIEAIRNKEVKDQQSRLRGMADVSKKILTYDFDGKFIVMAPVRLDKLPSLGSSVTHTVSKAEVQKQQLLAISNQNEKSIPEKQESTSTSNMGGNAQSTEQQLQLEKTKKQKEIEKQQQLFERQQRQQQQLLLQQQQQFQPSKIAAIQKGMEAKEVFDAFGMAKGVTLSESNKQKKGPSYGKSLDMLNKSQLSGSLLNGTRMTKSEYNLLILGGNLNRTDTNNNSISMDSMNNSLVVHTEGNITNNNIHKDISFLNSSIHKNNTSSYSYGSLRKKNYGSKSVIKIANQSRLSEIFYDEDDYSAQNSVQFQQEGIQHEKSKSDLNKKRNTLNSILNPVDEFNLKIFNGNQQDSYSTEVLPPIKAPRIKTDSQKRLNQSIGNLPTNPRERAPKHVIYTNFHKQKLPSPGVGQTIGHGIGLGFNPIELMNVEGILRKQNQSANESRAYY